MEKTLIMELGFAEIWHRFVITTAADAEIDAYVDVLVLNLKISLVLTLVIAVELALVWADACTWTWSLS